jgi:hypothetical protein
VLIGPADNAVVFDWEPHDGRWAPNCSVAAAPTLRLADHSDLDHLTDADRELIRAVTGEGIQRGQTPQERPLSAFAMQIAVDRRSGVLPAEQAISVGYLQRTQVRLAALGVPVHPFAGANFTRAVAYLSSRGR